jgi:hypothetical protein
LVKGIALDEKIPEKNLDMKKGAETVFARNNFA